MKLIEIIPVFNPSFVDESGNPESLIQKLMRQNLGGGRNYKIMEFYKKLNDKYSLYESQRLDLCEKYGKPNKENTAYEFKGENKKKFQTDYNELLQTEPEGLEKLKLLIRDEDNLTLTPVDMLNLSSVVEFIVEDDDKEVENT